MWKSVGRVAIQIIGLARWACLMAGGLGGKQHMQTCNGEGGYSQTPMRARRQTDRQTGQPHRGAGAPEQQSKIIELDVLRNR